MFYMPVTGMAHRELRLNDVDWRVLETLQDGRRYTQSHLANDLTEFEDVSYDWIRQRVKNLNDNGLIDTVGSSAMYEITDGGHAALELREEVNVDNIKPVDFGDMVRDRAEASSN
jgi:DNA-binding Lrp family transcriptional regulator